MDPTFTKTQRRRIREVARIAYDRDLAQELAGLEGEFRRWRSGEIDSFALSAAIHQFHQGPSRKLFSQYDDSSPEWAVAHAIHRGVVSAEEAGSEALEALAKHLAFLREQGA
jgi:hypothetical protein